MQKNVGGYDRIARFLVGPILILVGAASFGGLLTLAAGTVGVVLAGLAVLVGAVLTVTAATQKCPLNAVVGLDTYRDRSTQHSSTDDPNSSIR
jgi:hypothetical protein